MCFSPAASFIAGGTLSAAGIYTLRQAKTDAQRPFAAIPLLFGIQQIIEGFVWLSFDAPYFHQAATYAYVMFSHVLWPTFMPFAVLMLEPDVRRRPWLGFCVFLGCVTSALLFATVLQGPVTSAVVGNCIAYSVPIPGGLLVPMIYVVSACGSCFLSSKKFVRVFGFTLVGSLAIAYWSYRAAFYSVWCFFAAILSLIVFVHLRQKEHH